MVPSVCANTVAIPGTGANESTALIADCNALLAAAPLLTDTTGLNWETTNIISTWNGITLTMTRVTGLNLPNRNLTGTIPAALGNLTALTTLNLYSNTLTGNIPASLANLSTTLQYLRLHSNQLRGQITPSLNVLTNLEEFTISGNDNISECIPPSLWKEIPASDKGILPQGWRGCCAGSQAVRAVDSTEPLVYASGSAHSGLVNDCNVLLDVKDTLQGTGTLNWDTSVNMADWTGMISLPLNHGNVGWDIAGSTSLGAANRVIGLEFSTWNRNSRVTNGSLPAELKDLSALRVLVFWSNIPNQLVGATIPPAWGDGFNDLRVLWINTQGLTGTIPPELRGLNDTLYFGNANGVQIHGNSSLRGCHTINSNADSFSGLPRCPTDYNTCYGSTAIPGYSNEELPSLVSDCNVLVEAQNSLRGSLNWNTGSLITDWYGIGFDDNASPTQVITLDLSSRNLSGTIPTALGALTNPQTLRATLSVRNVYSNYTRGSLANLQALNLSDNQLTGTIPVELGNLSTTLQSLNLYSNTLTGRIPERLGNLATLETLNLARNSLTGTIPAALGNLSNLQTLDLRNNQLSGTIPAALGNLSNTLQTLNLAGNTITGCLPDGLERMSDLTRTLELCTPPTATPTPTPTPLCVGSSAVPDPEDPNQIADCRTLLRAKPTLDSAGSLNWDLNVTMNTWDGITVASSRVITVAIDSANTLTGTIPAQLSNLSALRELRLSGQTLTGTIPTELGNLTNLRTLNLSSNQLTDSIPARLGNIVTLETLNLSSNQLTGSIPESLGNIVTLETLNLSSNQLTGKIPGPLANLSNLMTLRLNDNLLSSTIPAQLAALSGTLRTLYIGGSNTIGGCVVSGLWSRVTMSDTSSLGECITEPTLEPTSTPTHTATATPTHTPVPPTATPVTPAPSGNGGGGGGGCGGSTQRPTCTNGTVVANPSANAALVQDCVLLLTNKETLEGSISTSSRLNWSETSGINTWEGVTIGGTPQRVIRLELDISGKTLAGSIPTTLSRLTGLQVLDISNNEFSGRIPVGLRALASLQVLDFSNNRLSGSMPTDLGSIATLQTLHLANNSLTGSIPTTLVDLSNLRSLSLAGNRFSGCIPNALTRVAQNDLSDIELSFCDPVTPTATPTVTPTATATPVGQDLFLPLVRK